MLLTLPGCVCLSDGWGFCLYKTFYDKELDAQWPKFLERFNAYAIAGLHYEIRYLAPDDIQAATTNFRCPVFIDRERFDGKSPDELRVHFLQRLTENDRSPEEYDAKSRVFLAVNRKDFESVLALPEEPHADGIFVPYEERAKHTVTLVDATYDPEHEKYKPNYVGWMKLYPRGVYTLTAEVDEFDLSQVIPKHRDAQGTPVWIS